MSCLNRWNVWAQLFAAVFFGAAACGDILRWDNGQVIPGTEGITPGPGVHLENRNLAFAELSEKNLANAYFTGANLHRAHFRSSNLTNAELTGAFISGAGFLRTGLTKEQLYSTASYQTKDLRGILFSNVGQSARNLTGWDFSGQDLSGAEFWYATLTDADLKGAKLTNTTLSASTLTGADLTGANVTRARFQDTTRLGFTKEQLYSTASYQAKDLRGIELGTLGSGFQSANDLTGWDFNGQNLTDARFDQATLTNADLTGAVVRGATFSRTRGFTADQIYSTASYQAKDLQGVWLGGIDLTGWDFSEQNLTGAGFAEANLSNANFAGAVVTNTSFNDSRGFTTLQLLQTASYQAKNLQGIGLSSQVLVLMDFSGFDLSGANLSFARLGNVSLNGAIVKGASFSATTSRGFTREQLYETASYQAKDLRGIGLGSNELAGWDFSGQDLTGATFYGAALFAADFTGAIVRGAQFGETTGFTKEQLYSTASYQAKDLRGFGMSPSWFPGGLELAGWDFRGQNLSDASFSFATLTNVDLTGANLTGAYLGSTKIAKTNFTGANLTRASFWEATLSSVNLTQTNLTSADFYRATLANVDLTRADSRGAFELNLGGTFGENLIRPGGRIDSLNLAAGEKLVAFPGVPIPVKFDAAFSIAPSATFDQTDNAAIVDYAGTSPAATVRERILSGRGGAGLGGKWTETGITSSTAAAANITNADSRSLGYADNLAMPLGAYTIFRGEPVDDTSVLIAFTRTGDANLDGVVNDDDVTIVGATYAPGSAQASWALGDFDYNGFVDDDDVTLLNAFYDPSAPPLNSPTAPRTGEFVHSGVSAVPEPSTEFLAIVLLALATTITVGIRAHNHYDTHHTHQVSQ